jgi:hypothetical protein
MVSESIEAKGLRLGYWARLADSSTARSAKGAAAQRTVSDRTAVTAAPGQGIGQRTGQDSERHRLAASTQ